MVYINPNQHCTNTTDCPFTTSHTATYCGYEQPRQCDCHWDYPERGQVIVSSDKERQVRERIEKTITDMLGTVLQPIIVTALTDKLMEVVNDYASDEYERGRDDAQAATYYDNI